MRNLFLILLASSTLLGPLQASAQTGKGFKTIEGAVGGARAVYLGAITRVDLDDASAGQSSYDTKCTLTIRVKQAIKGKAEKTIQVRTDHWPYHMRLEVYQSWVSHGTEFLWFDKGPHPDPVQYEDWDQWQLDAAVPEQKMYGGRAANLINMKFVALTDKGEIVKEAVAFAQDYPRQLESTYLTFMCQKLRLPGGSGIYNAILFPVCPELEQMAKSMILDPESYFVVSSPDPSGNLAAGFAKGNASTVQLKTDAIKVLSYFKTSANIVFLKSCLTDLNSHVVDSTEPKHARRVYGVREAAYKVLEGWNVEVEKPVLEEALSPTE